MSAIKSLTNTYGSFFVTCADIAVCPYFTTLKAFWDPQHPNKKDFLIGVAVCLALSIVVPILPTLFSITSAIAMFAASLAVASMFVAYPIAIVMDALNGDRREDPSRQEHSYNMA